MREHQLSASDLKASGKDGRIIKSDVLGKITPSSKDKPVGEQTPTFIPSPDKNAPAQHAESLNADQRGQKRLAISQLRKKIAARLVAVKNETAMLTTFNELDLSAVIAARKKYKEMFIEKHQVGLGFMSFFAKACTTALLEFPLVNARIELEQASIVQHSYVDLGVAVSAPKGLMVPVIRNAEQLDLHQIEKQIVSLAKKARESSISLAEMTGGTFTITNGGVFGSMLSTPILNPPQSAILGMHNIVQRPTVVAGEIKIRPIMYLALSYDHRVIDGKEAVSFLVRVKSLLEDPLRLLLKV